MLVSSESGVSRPGGNLGLKGATTSTAATTIDVSQPINNLAPGTTINVGGYVKSLLDAVSAGTVTFSLYFDDVLLDQLVSTPGTTKVYQMLSSPSAFVVTGGDSHTLKLRVEAAGFRGAIFAADDFYVIVASGPGDVPVCNPTPAPTRACFSAQSTNYVRNPGFDNDPVLDTAMAYWSVSQGSAYSTNSWVWDYAGRGGGNGFLGFTIAGDAGKVDSTQFLKQENINIPEGAIIDIRGYVNPRRASTVDKPLSLTLKFDNQVVQSYTPQTTGFTRIGTTFGSRSNTRVTIVGSGPHTLSLEVRTAGVENADIYYADDFEIKVVSGPGGLRLCPS
ncbi:uncharacterized protein K460DRAFT_400317 [Cucurbitaria berberidis CBS 394.84]|uniref:Uncharacterized protein n=1 Tax=Cucurbitaria berberidis CBS 394.84 TaxID=1168544 RepID=A0A9P4GRT6_9PLEO|nr:uncharacterized protein K460DRAFT_400317 [Cucurbitaria berberidis CBS 394.84]KAF1850246.1 hypothetical protein K460DRAFT_400317 [Cucurbitaria berberidis CBS 394.84]